MNNQNHYNAIYYDMLVKSFLSAKGLKSSNIDLNSESFVSEFAGWVKERRKIGLDYLSFIESLVKLNSTKEVVAEIGKGESDTLITGDSRIIITPFTKNIKREKPELLVEGFLWVERCRPIIIRGNKPIDISKCNIKRFITHNPYSKGNIRNWETLHNSEKYNITVGIYGSVYDHDIEDKIKVLNQLRDKLNDNCFYEKNVERGDIYMHVVSSNRKILKPHI